MKESRLGAPIFGRMWTDEEGVSLNLPPGDPERLRIEAVVAERFRDANEQHRASYAAWRRDHRPVTETRDQLK